MYTGIPRRNRRLIQGVLAGSWIISGLGGISVGIFTPLLLVDALGPIWVWVCVAAICIGSLGAAYGAVRLKYEWEWWSAWFTSAGLAPFVIAIWSLVFVGQKTEWLSNALLLTSLIAFYAVRALMCAGHAAKLRAVHEEVHGDGTGPVRINGLS